jgi:hypothetical protein
VRIANRVAPSEYTSARGPTLSSSRTGIEKAGPISPRAMSIRSATIADAVGPAPAPGPSAQRILVGPHRRRVRAP